MKHPEFDPLGVDLEPTLRYVTRHQSSRYVAFRLSRDSLSELSGTLLYCMFPPTKRGSNISCLVDDL
jgi:hypothetical protein